MRWGLLGFVLIAACVRSNPNTGIFPDGGVPADLAATAGSDLAHASSVEDLFMPPVEAGSLVRQDFAAASDLAGVDLAGRDLAGGGGPDMALVIVCGDNRCDGGEDCITCAGDCGQCVCEAKKASCDGIPGCEVDVNAVDEGEPENDVCSGKTSLGIINENTTQTITTHRLLGAGDSDTFSLTFKEGTHICAGGAQSYRAIVTVTGPDGAILKMRSPSAGTCNDSWKTAQDVGICYAWPGTCFVTDDLAVAFQVLGASSCAAYKLQVSFCPLDSTSCCTDEGCCN